MSEYTSLFYCSGRIKPENICPITNEFAPICEQCQLLLENQGGNAMKKLSQTIFKMEKMGENK